MTPEHQEWIRRNCIAEAQLSNCKKLRFGCVLAKEVQSVGGMEDGVIILARGHNAMMAPLAHLCEGECIRSSIPSRTQSMIGACGHAEEAALWDAVVRGINPAELDVFLVGLDMEGNVLGGNSSYSCIRCAVQMYRALVGSVNFWRGDLLVKVDRMEAVSTAIDFAMGKTPKQPDEPLSTALFQCGYCGRQCRSLDELMLHEHRAHD